MNNEQMKTPASRAIENFRKHNDTSCVLYIRDGLVCCCPAREVTAKAPACLIFSRLQQKLGLTDAGWNLVGTELFNQYNKEKACQAHQKH